MFAAFAKAMDALKRRLKKPHKLWLLWAVLLGIGLLLGPVPAWLLDGLLAANLTLAVTLCVVAANAGEPRRLPQLPALLFISVLVRLGLNIAALRLLFSAGGGEAGWLIRQSGDWLLGGDAIFGAVLISAIGVVEYLVLVRGGERAAEVAARFVLDALPGRQAAIEADLRSGAIDQTQAQKRRQALDHEAQIYGALDGALRLLKGDVIAALLLLSLGFAGGLLLGVLRQGLDVAQAAERYGLWMVGQGLLTQVPVLLNTAAAGLLLTRGVAVQPAEGPKAAQHLEIRIEAGAGLKIDTALLLSLRETLSARLGFAVPELRFLQLDSAPTGRRLLVRLFGVPIFGSELHSDSDVRTVLLGLLLPAAADLLTLDIVQQTLEDLGQQQPALLRETVPRRIDLGRLTALLRRLLTQRVWPLDVRAVLETLATLPRMESDLDALTEQVRGGLGRFLISGLLRTPSSEEVPTSSGQNGLPALLLSNEIEELLRETRSGPSALGMGGPLIEPELERDIVQAVLAARTLAPEAALLCHADVRRLVEQLLCRTPESLPVLAYSEIPPSVPVIVLGRVEPGPSSGSGHSSVRPLPFVDIAAVPWQMRPTTTSSSTATSNSTSTSTGRSGL